MEEDRRTRFSKIPKQQRIELIEGWCDGCENLKWFGEYYRCEAYTEFYFLWGKDLLEGCPARKVSDSKLARECFKEEQRKPIKGSGGEKNDRTHKMFGKDRMKDNRAKLWDGKLSRF